MTLRKRERRPNEMIFPIGSGWKTVPRNSPRFWQRPKTLSGVVEGLWDDNDLFFSLTAVYFTWLIILQYPFELEQSWELLQYSQCRLVRIKLQFTFSISLICCTSLRNASTFSTIWSTLSSFINLELDVLKMQWEQSKLSTSLMSSRLDLPVAANTVG